MDHEVYYTAYYPDFTALEKKRLRELFGKAYPSQDDDLKHEQVQHILTRISPSLRQWLKTKDVLPFLRQMYVLTETEMLHLRSGSIRPQEQAIRLVEFLMNKGSYGIACLYLCLIDSSEQLTGLPAHYQLAGELKEIVQAESGVTSQQGGDKREVGDTTESVHMMVKRLLGITISRQTSQAFISSLGLSPSEFQTPPTELIEICQHWLVKRSVSCDMEELVEALVTTKGLGKYTSHLSPAQRGGVPTEIRNFFLSLGDKWVDIALFLGFSQEDVQAITDTHGDNPEMQVMEFLQVWQLPECGRRIQPLLHKLKSLSGIVEPRKQRANARPGTLGYMSKHLKTDITGIPHRSLDSYSDSTSYPNPTRQTMGAHTARGSSTSYSTPTGHTMGAHTARGSSTSYSIPTGHTMGAHTARGSSTSYSTPTGHTMGAHTARGSSTSYSTPTGQTVGAHTARGSSTSYSTPTGQTMGAHTARGSSTSYSTPTGQTVGAHTARGSSTSYSTPTGQTVGAHTARGSSTSYSTPTGQTVGAHTARGQISRSYSTPTEGPTMGAHTARGPSTSSNSTSAEGPAAVGYSSPTGRNSGRQSSSYPQQQYSYQSYEYGSGSSSQYARSAGYSHPQEQKTIVMLFIPGDHSQSEPVGGQRYGGPNSEDLRDQEPVIEELPDESPPGDVTHTPPIKQPETGQRPPLQDHTSRLMTNGLPPEPPVIPQTHSEAWNNLPSAGQEVNGVVLMGNEVFDDRNQSPAHAEPPSLPNHFPLLPLTSGMGVEEDNDLSVKTPDSPEPGFPIQETTPDTESFLSLADKTTGGRMATKHELVAHSLTSQPSDLSRAPEPESRTPVQALQQTPSSLKFPKDPQLLTSYLQPTGATVSQPSFSTERQSQLHQSSFTHKEPLTSMQTELLPDNSLDEPNNELPQEATSLTNNLSSVEPSNDVPDNSVGLQQFGSSIGDMDLVQGASLPSSLAPSPVPLLLDHYREHGDVVETDGVAKDADAARDEAHPQEECSEDVVRAIDDPEGLELLTALVDSGANINVPTATGTYPIHLAVSSGNAEKTLFLLNKEASVNSARSDGKRPLHLACIKQDFQMVQILVEKGANVAAQDKQGLTCLHFKETLESHDVVIYLIHNDAPVDIPSKDSYLTPLLVCCFAGHSTYDSAHLLITKGASVNGSPLAAMKPLITASSEGHDRMVELLLDNGADINITDQDGNTALLKACVNKHVLVARKLCERASGVNQPNKDGMTPLMAAVSKNSQELANTLITHGANVNCIQVKQLTLGGATYSLEMTPLSDAALNGNTNIVQLLVDNRAEVNAISETAFPPIAFAVMKNHNAVVEYFLKLNDLDASLTGLAKPFVVSVKAQNRESAELLAERFGGIERLLEEAVQHSVHDLVEHIHIYQQMLTDPQPPPPVSVQVPLVEPVPQPQHPPVSVAQQPPMEFQQEEGNLMNDEPQNDFSEEPLNQFDDNEPEDGQQVQTQVTSYVASQGSTPPQSAASLDPDDFDHVELNDFSEPAINQLEQTRQSTASRQLTATPTERQSPLLVQQESNPSMMDYNPPPSQSNPAHVVSTTQHNPQPSFPEFPHYSHANDNEPPLRAVLTQEHPLSLKHTEEVNDSEQEGGPTEESAFKEEDLSLFAPRAKSPPPAMLRPPTPPPPQQVAMLQTPDVLRHSMVEVLHEFAQICISAAVRQRGHEWLIEKAASTDYPHLLEFFMQYFHNPAVFARDGKLVAEFIGGSPSPLNFLLAGHLVSRGDFEAVLQDIGRPDFVEQLMLALHQFPGSEHLPYTAPAMMDALFNQHFSIGSNYPNPSSLSSSSPPLQFQAKPPQPKHEFPESGGHRLGRGETKPPEAVTRDQHTASNGHSSPVATTQVHSQGANTSIQPPSSSVTQDRPSSDSSFDHAEAEPVDYEMNDLSVTEDSEPLPDSASGTSLEERPQVHLPPISSVHKETPPPTSTLMERPLSDSGCGSMKDGVRSDHSTASVHSLPLALSDYGTSVPQGSEPNILSSSQPSHTSFTPQPTPRATSHLSQDPPTPSQPPTVSTGPTRSSSSPTSSSDARHHGRTHDSQMEVTRSHFPQREPVREPPSKVTTTSHKMPSKPPPSSVAKVNQPGPQKQGTPTSSKTPSPSTPIHLHKDTRPATEPKMVKPSRIPKPLKTHSPMSSRTTSTENLVHSKAGQKPHPKSAEKKTPPVPKKAVANAKPAIAVAAIHKRGPKPAPYHKSPVVSSNPHRAALKKKTSASSGRKFYLTSTDDETDFEEQKLRNPTPKLNPVPDGQFIGRENGVSFPPTPIGESDGQVLFNALVFRVKKWQLLGRYLELEDEVIEAIEKENQFHIEQCYKMFVKWREQFGSNATYARLAEAMRNIMREDLLPDIANHIPQVTPRVSNRHTAATVATSRGEEEEFKLDISAEGSVDLQTVMDQFSAQANNKGMKCAEITLFYLSHAHPREDLPLHFTLPLDDIRVLQDLCLSAAFRTRKEQVVQLCVKYLGD